MNYPFCILLILATWHASADEYPWYLQGNFHPTQRLEFRISNELDLASQAMYIAQSTEDAVEGPRSFAEKRDPQFKGR